MHLTIQDIKAIVKRPGRYHLTYKRTGKTFTRPVMIWAVSDVGERTQVRSGAAEPMIWTSEESFLLHEIVALAPYKVQTGIAMAQRQA